MSRVLLHVSDLHFGRVPQGMTEALVAVARQIAPDVLVVSGDLTQRARIEEFEQARAFLDQLPYPRIVIPGNHDVPLFNPYGRFVERLSRFRRYITEELGYLEVPVVVVTDDPAGLLPHGTDLKDQADPANSRNAPGTRRHWSGFRPERLLALVQAEGSQSERSHEALSAS